MGIKGAGDGDKRGGAWGERGWGAGEEGAGVWKFWVCVIPKFVVFY